MRISSIIAVGLLVALAGCATNQKVGEKDWFTAWGMSHNARATTPAMSGRTVRMILMPSISGNSVRVKLENTMGEAPVVFSGAYIGVAGEGASVQEKSITRLTFAGKPGLSLAAGQGAYSDPVPFKVNAFEKLSLSLDVQSATDISTHHLGLRTNWSAAGARASDASAAGFEPLPEIPALNTGQWPFYWVAALDVQSTETTGTIVLFADSITDGRCSTRDDKGIVQPNLDQRWGDVLATRLVARPKREQKAIAIAAISGNRVLARGNGPSALERLERDVLDRAGVTHVVFFEGTNDIASNLSGASNRRNAADHSLGARQGNQDHWRHGDPSRQTGPWDWLDIGQRSPAARAERMDPHDGELRRCNRLRRANEKWTRREASRWRIRSGNSDGVELRRDAPQCRGLQGNGRIRRSQTVR